MIQNIGHIRAFAVFGATLTATTLLYGLYLSPWFWAILRFSNGITIFGLFMVIESWLNECSEPSYRGRVFSIYMTLSYAGIAIGQQFLNVGDIRGQELFIIAGLVLSLCLVPVSATRGVHPRLPETKRYQFLVIFRKAPLAMLGCMVAGLANSAFYTMTPVFCNAVGLTLRQLSWIMSLTVFCGLAAQWLVGILSDRFDRTIVMSVTATAMTTLSWAMFIDEATSFGRLAVGFGLFGTLLFAIYPLAVARAHDIFGGQDVVAVSTGLLFAYSIGACVSPLLASSVMSQLGSPFGLFAFWGLTSGILAVLIVYLRKHENVAVVSVEDQVSFVPMKSTSPVIMSLEPMSDGRTDNIGTPRQRKQEKK